MAERGKTLRIANISGFYGDKPEAAREMLEGGDVDFLTGDYLAELTMLNLHKARERKPGAGYAASFLKQMEQVLAPALERNVRIVVNAGGLNPRGMAEELRTIAAALGLRPRVAHIEGDDILGRLPELLAAGHDLAHLDTGEKLADSNAEPISANAYLGAWGIVEALNRDSDVVICPRVTDASLVVGPAAWHFAWNRDDWDALASAVVAGHIIECGPQTTGGNYAFFDEVPSLVDPGFPLVEIEADGRFVVTKHAGTDGLVSVGTVTAQLLYEVAEPRYANADVVARFDTVRLAQQGQDRVEVFGVRGEPRPETLKVCINYIGGYRNTVGFGITGIDVDEKAAAIERALFARVGGRDQFDDVKVELQRGDPSATTQVGAVSFLRITVKDEDASKVGRAFSNRATEMLLGSVPGLFTEAPPGPGREFGIYWPALISASEVSSLVACEDGVEVILEDPDLVRGESEVRVEPYVRTEVAEGPMVDEALGRAFGARSGDKGGNANVGVWARSDSGYAWLADFLTAERFQELVPESRDLEVRRFELPNIWALNFVVVGWLGQGVASCTRTDPQAKGLGEFLRSRRVAMPRRLLDS